MGTNLPIDALTDRALYDALMDRLRPVTSRPLKSRESGAEVNRVLGRHRENVVEEIIAALHELHPDDFESLCEALLQKLDFEDVSKVGAHWAGTLGDGGGDLTARMSRPGLPPLVVRVQAKRQRANVGPGAIQQLRGALRAGEQGIFITTSRFTRAAVEEAVAEGKPPVGRLDGPAIAAYMIANEVGVRTATLSIPRFDRRALQRILRSDEDAPAS